MDLRARLASVRSRGELRRLADQLDRDPEARAEAEAMAATRGIEADLSSKALVRALLDRSEAAQVRRNPIHRDEAFTCAHCGAEVPPGGAPVRDHCPTCLRGLHVDNVPGDRAAGCGGVLDPIAIDRRPEVIIRYRCRRCGGGFTVRAHPQDRIPPSLSVGDLPA